jgi:hypothetical protein
MPPGMEVVRIEAVVNGLAFSGVFRKPIFDQVGYMVAAPNYEISVAKTGTNYSIIELGKPFAVHAEYDTGFWIQSSKNWHHLRKVMDLDDICIPESRKKRRL